MSDDFRASTCQLTSGRWKACFRAYIDRIAATFDNPDFMETVIHSCRLAAAESRLIQRIWEIKVRLAGQHPNPRRMCSLIQQIPFAGLVLNESMQKSMVGNLRVCTPDNDLIAKLKTRAARHGRSAEAEHHEILM